MVVDRRVVVVNDAHGTTIWACEDPDVVARGVATFEAEWAAATPAVAPGAPPPYTRRMTEVGAHLATGRTDREIAQAVGISERSVSAVVRGAEPSAGRVRPWARHRPDQRRRLSAR